MKTLATFASFLSTSRLFGTLSIIMVGLCFNLTPAKAQTWMVSTTAYTKLGVLDKYNLLGGYTAIFVVTSERDSQEYILEKTVPKGESGVDVLFPSEPSDPQYFKNIKGLAAQPSPGRYTWECRVNGKKAVGGHFVYPETGNDITVIAKEQH